MRGLITPHRRMLLALWALVSLAAGLMGPFGTYDALPLLWRLPYWTVVAGGSILLSELAGRLVASWQVNRRLVRLLAFGVVYGLVLSGLINLLNTAVFAGWPWWQGWLQIAGFVAAVECLVFAVVWLLAPRPPKAAHHDPELHLMARLTPANRAPLVRLEAQDHYLLVVTCKGQELVLMRMADAMAELANASGMQVHRSHWVARRAMQSLRRDGGRMWLVLANGGGEVPVSRANQAGLRALLGS
ncbi:MAG: LytTR family DNA-binding domain-containing protein [Paracoccaceae bacterium]